MYVAILVAHRDLCSSIRNLHLDLVTWAKEGTYIFTVHVHRQHG